MSGQFADEVAISVSDSSDIGRATALACAGKRARVSFIARCAMLYATGQDGTVVSGWSVH